jgi:hypothetical protein
MANIKMLRLSTGENVLCEIVSEHHDDGVFSNSSDCVYSDHIKVSNAVELSIVPNPQDRQQMSYGFLPFPQYAAPKSKDLVTILVRHIVFCLEPDVQFLEQYNAIFNKILVPESRIILGK